MFFFIFRDSQNVPQIYFAIHELGLEASLLEDRDLGSKHYACDAYTLKRTHFPQVSIGTSTKKLAKFWLCFTLRFGAWAKSVLFWTAADMCRKLKIQLQWSILCFSSCNKMHDCLPTEYYQNLAYGCLLTVKNNRKFCSNKYFTINGILQEEDFFTTVFINWGTKLSHQKQIPAKKLNIISFLRQDPSRKSFVVHTALDLIVVVVVMGDKLLRRFVLWFIVVVTLFPLAEPCSLIFWQPAVSGLLCELKIRQNFRWFTSAS